MQLLVLSATAVRQVLGYRRCADAMREALAARARGEVFQPLRSVLMPEGAAGFMALMPAYQAGPAAGYGLKAICITPANPASGLDSHQGIVLLSTPKTGSALATLEPGASAQLGGGVASAVTIARAAGRGRARVIVGTGASRTDGVAPRPLAEVRSRAPRLRRRPGSPPMSPPPPWPRPVLRPSTSGPASPCATPSPERGWW
jgi:ornithine cyclodeaminase